MNESINADTFEETHEQVMTILPWYVNGSLDGVEYQRVQKHIAQCKLCEKEVEALQELEMAVHNQDTKVTWQPDQHHLKSILNRIDGVHQTEQSSQISPSGSIWQRMCNWFNIFFDVSSTMRWVFAAQSALVIILSVVIAMVMPESTEKSFQTFSTEANSSYANNQQIRIVFSETFQLSELSSLLTSIPATIVRGPSQYGVFTIELESKDADLTQVLVTLRQNTHVLFAEAIKLDK